MATTIDAQSNAATGNDYGTILAAISGGEQSESADTDASLDSLASGLDAGELSFESKIQIVTVLSEAGPFDGFEFRSQIATFIVNGRKAYEDGKVLSDENFGDRLQFKSV